MDKVTVKRRIYRYIPCHDIEKGCGYSSGVVPMNNLLFVGTISNVKFVGFSSLSVLVLMKNSLFFGIENTLLNSILTD